MRYRLYLLNAANHVIDAIDVDCNTDDHAFAAARDQVYSGKTEIWQGARKVGVCAAVRSPTPDDVDEQQSPFIRSGLNGPEAAR